MSHRPEPSGRAVNGEVDGLDIGGQHGRRLFFCTTLTGRRGGHTPFVQAGGETSDTDAETVEPDPGSFWEGHSGGEWRCGDENTESCAVVHPLRTPLVIRPERRMLLLSDELMSCCAVGTNECLDTQEE